MNHGFAVFASDRQLYKELSTHRRLTDKVIETGSMSLPKTANAEESNASCVCESSGDSTISSRRPQYEHKLVNNNHLRDSVWVKIGRGIEGVFNEASSSDSKHSKTQLSNNNRDNSHV